MMKLFFLLYIASGIGACLGPLKDMAREVNDGVDHKWHDLRFYAYNAVIFTLLIIIHPVLLPGRIMFTHAVGKWSAFIRYHHPQAAISSNVEHRRLFAVLPANEHFDDDFIKKLPEFSTCVDFRIRNLTMHAPEGNRKNSVEISFLDKLSRPIDRAEETVVVPYQDIDMVWHTKSERSGGNDGDIFYETVIRVTVGYPEPKTSEANGRSKSASSEQKEKRSFDC
jgi:hypothetical protein